MTIITKRITRMKKKKDSNSNNNNSSKHDNNKSLSNDNSDRNYDWSYVLLTQAFLKRAFYNHE